jgi:hypothetical protein
MARHHSAVLIGMSLESQEKLAKILGRKMTIYAETTLEKVTQVLQNIPNVAGCVWVQTDRIRVTPEWIKSIKEDYPLIEIVIVSKFLTQEAVGLFQEGVFAHVAEDMPKGQITEVVTQITDQLYLLSQLQFLCKKETQIWRRILQQLHKARRIFKPVSTDQILAAFPDLGKMQGVKSSKKPNVLIVNQNDEEWFSSFKKIYTPFFAQSQEQIISILGQYAIDAVLFDLSSTVYQEGEWISLAHQKYPNIPKIGYVHPDIVRMLSATTRSEFNALITTLDIPELIWVALSKAIQQRYIEAACATLYHESAKMHATYEERIGTLEIFFEAQQHRFKPVQMSDIFHLFPDLRATGIPEGLHIPEQSVSNGIEPFVTALYEKLAQFNPSVEV